MMNDDTPKKFDRTVAIFIQLQSKRVVKAQELANRFNVSLRTIYRDIRTLEASGVPIFGEAGTGYSLMEGYRLPPIMFTQEEATSFVAAEKLMQHYVDKGVLDHFSSAIYKIKSVLKSVEKDWVSDLEPQILIHSRNRNLHNEVPNALSSLFVSVSKKRMINMLYQTMEGSRPEMRIVEPLGVFHENKFWYIIAYCHLRNDYRQFRTDRIKSLEILDRPFTLSHPSIGEFLAKREAGDRTKVVLRMNQRLARYLVWQRDNYGFVSEEKVEPDEVRLTFMSKHVNDDFARWYMMFADLADIEEPVSLRERILELAKSAMDRLPSSMRDQTERA